MPIIPTLTTQIIEMAENQELSNHTVRSVAKPNTSQRSVILERMHQTDRLIAIEDQRDRVITNGETHQTARMKFFRLQPKL